MSNSQLIESKLKKIMTINPQQSKYKKRKKKVNKKSKRNKTPTKLMQDR
jgi:hypothetical protein